MGTDQLCREIQEIKRLCKERGLPWEKATFDTSTSRSRLPEWAWDMLTCVRPTHRIWLLGEERYATPLEMLRAHGVTPEVFQDPSALNLLQGSQCQHMAGNAYTTSVLIAKILATMVNSPAWQRLAGSSSRPSVLEACSQAWSRKRSADNKLDEEFEGSQPKKQKRQTLLKKKRKHDGEDPDPEDGEKNTQNPKRKKIGRKGSCLSIAKKMHILKLWEELKQSHKHAEKDCRGHSHSEFSVYI